MAIKKKLPTQIVASLSSSGGDSGTTYFAGYVLDVSDKLREKIDQYYEVVAGDDGLHSISLDISGFALPGGDNDGPDGVRERDKEKLEELLDKLQEDEPRVPTAREFNFLKKMEAYGCRGERLVITKYSDPFIVCHEKYGYEEFSSVSIGLLAPAGLVRYRERMAAEHEERMKEREAEEQRASASQQQPTAAAP